ncbi:hypothetical protein BJV78DRAFT_1169764 [Lactifluus subvellereus]|nr:hypothetical protein BJV78DRAFT_1169764 [Lactifluus subvellereus]
MVPWCRCTMVFSLIPRSGPATVNTVTVRVWCHRNGNRQNTTQCSIAAVFITLAYMFADYRSQGQTILYVTVDLASPPSGSSSQFNVYTTIL